MDTVVSESTRIIGTFLPNVMWSEVATKALKPQEG
jgi:hypothetical protein